MRKLVGEIATLPDDVKNFTFNFDMRALAHDMQKKL